MGARWLLPLFRRAWRRGVKQVFSRHCLKLALRDESQVWMHVFSEGDFVKTTRFIIRTYHRIPIRCEMYYMGEGFLGKGTVINLSRNGFRVLGDCLVVPGMELVVRLSLSGRDEPVEIQRGVVRWVRGLMFGVRVMKVKPESEDRIGTFLSARLRAYCALP